jgi:SAM-dependent methyltransferase
MVDDDRWLEPWLNTVRERAGPAPVLELGCGNGRDTATLAAAGVRVVAVDLSARAIEMARAAVGNAQFHVADIRDPFPLAHAHVVVASLSLHYFTWAETTHIVERVGDVLRDRGLLICRLNSTRDHHYGASGHPRIEDDYYLVNGRTKRFFDRSAVERLFDGWRILALEERTIHRYERPKVVWELAVEAAGAHPHGAEG